MGPLYLVGVANEDIDRIALCLGHHLLKGVLVLPELTNERIIGGWPAQEPSEYNEQTTDGERHPGQELLILQHVHGSG